jgi:hypothetical protein
MFLIRMKKLLAIPLLLLCLFSIGQSVVNRSGSQNTVMDARWGATYNMFIPRYSDTVAANLNLGVDTCGAIIYTYTGNKLWKRDCNPKAWSEVGSGSGGNPNSNIGTAFRLGVFGTNNLKTIGVGYSLTGDSTTTSNVITFKLDSATLFLTALRRGDTTFSGVTTQLLTKKKIDSLGALITAAGTKNFNIGLGYRPAVFGTNNIKTFFFTYGGSLDSTTNTNALSFRVDTSFGGLTTQALTKKKIDSLAATVTSTTVQRGINTILTGTGSSIDPIKVNVAGAPSNAIYAAGSGNITTRRYQKYLGFPWPVVVRDTIFAYLKFAGNHAVDGPFTVYKSVDGGAHFDSLKVINGLDVSVWDVGATNVREGVKNSGDTIVIAYQTNSNLKKIYWMYSPDRGQTYVTGDSTTAATGHLFSPFGTPKQLPSGRMLNYYYDYDSTSSKWSAYLMYSDDYIHWAFYDTIARHTSQFGFNFSFTEGDFAIIPGTTDANSKLVCVMREEALTVPQQYTSVDGGHTWKQAGYLSDLGGVFPIFVQYYLGKIYLVGGERKPNGADPEGPLFYIFSMNGDPARVIDTAYQNYTHPTRIYRPTTEIKGGEADAGYTVSYIYHNTLMCAAYDLTVDYTPSGGDAKTVRSFVMPVLDIGFAQTYALANQSISTATETLVSMPYVKLDDGLYYNADSGFVICIRDGWYSINSHFTFSSDITGTYRQGYLKIVDHGVNDTTGNQLLSRTTIPGSTNTDYNRVELNAVAFVKEGEQIKVFARHDASGSLNLVNNEREKRSTLTIKRLE